MYLLTLLAAHVVIARQKPHGHMKNATQTTISRNIQTALTDYTRNAFNSLYLFRETEKNPVKFRSKQECMETNLFVQLLTNLLLSLTFCCIFFQHRITVTKCSV